MEDARLSVDRHEHDAGAVARLDDRGPYDGAVAQAEMAKSDAGSAASTDDLVAAQYSGAKAELRPIYDALIKAVGALGKDVEDAQV